jgi:hypothetical protein
MTRTKSRTSTVVGTCVACVVLGGMGSSCDSPVEVAKSADPEIVSEVSGPQPAPLSTATPPSPKLETKVPDEVLQASFPLLVALGLPDDEHEAMLELNPRFERRVAQCMLKLGFIYIPAITIEDDNRNVEIINSLNAAQRELYFSALNGTGKAGVSPDVALGCVGAVRPSVFILNSSLAPTFGPYLSLAMKGPAIVAGIAEIDECAAKPDPQSTPLWSGLGDCISEEFAQIKREAIRRAELTFLREHWDEVVAFRKITESVPG